MKLIRVLPTTLAAVLALSAGCPTNACPTGSIPTSDGRCVLDESGDAGLDAPAIDAHEATPDAPDARTAIDAYAPDAFLVIPDGCVPVEYWNDADGDGFGDMAMTPIRACTPPSGYVTNNTDCNDGCAACRPGASEICDMLDNNCNGNVDEGVTTTYYRDQDTDGHGDLAMPVPGCSMPAGYATSSDDCDDTCITCFPGNPEVCDSRDNNCNGVVDESVQTTYYRDADGDGHGLLSATTLACTMPMGYVLSNDDCNDACVTCFPGGTESCDLLDNNCNALTDEGVQTRFYLDSDNDAHGNALAFMDACTAPLHYVLLSDDCNDMCATCFPGSAEVCDTRDNDCNMLVDDRVGPIFYRDADSDGHGLMSISMQSCTMPMGFVPSSDDCNDLVPTTYTGAPELCNATDDNCNAAPDETFACVQNTPGLTCTTTCGSTGSRTCSATCTLPACTPPAEICNGVDDDCDAYTDESLRRWMGPTDAGLTTQRVELLPTTTGYVRLLGRTTGIYAQAYSLTGVATGGEVMLSPAATEFAATTNGTTLHLVTFTSGVAVGRSFSTATLAPLAAGVTLPIAEFAGAPRLLASTTNVLLIYTTSSGSMRALSRSNTWSGSALEQAFGQDGPYDVSQSESASFGYAATVNGTNVELWRLSIAGTTAPALVSIYAAGATPYAPQVAVGVASDGTAAVGILVSAGSSVRFLLHRTLPSLARTAVLNVDSAAAFGASSSGAAMDLTFAGGRFVGSWMTGTGINWRTGDITPILASPTVTTTDTSLGSVPLTSLSTSIVTVGAPSGSVLALHGRTFAPNPCRTWFRGC